MNPIRTLLPVLVAWLCGALLPQALAAPTYTDGTATFNFTLVDLGGQYAPRHVDAVWVTDASGRFMKTIRKDAANRRQYLYQWVAARGTWPYDNVDGYSGATAPNYNSPYSPLSVPWNCRNTNNVLQPDGLYYFYVEFTDRNGQGHYTTNGIPFFKGLTNVNSTFANFPNIRSVSVSYLPSLAYDIAVTAISPNFAPTNALVPVTVTITNKTSVPETFTVTLSNATSTALIGSQQVLNLAGNSMTNLTFTWNAAGLGVGSYSLLAQASAVPNETVLGDNTRMHTITLRPPTHDVGITGIGVPAEVRPEIAVSVPVSVTNRGDIAESFSVVLTDDTDARPIETNQVVGLAAQAATVTTFSWNTTTATWGPHTLRAVAATVAGETATADNIMAVLTSVIPAPTTNMLIARNSAWRYNDDGVDLGTVWRTPAYSDAAWPLGQGPLGYGDAPTNTVLDYGPDSAAKYPCYYFRSTFNLTNRPSSFVLRLRRDDGAVVYHNGVEIYRVNMPGGTVAYATWASSAIGGTDETTYFESSFPATNAVFGSNLLAVEVHQNAGDSSDLSFDLELLAVTVPFIPVHDLAVTGLTVPAQVRPGIRTNVVVTVTNKGTFNETFELVLTDETEAQVVGVRQLNNFVTNTVNQLSFEWNVPDVPFVTRTLRAVAGPVANEVNQVDNTNRLSVFVSPPMETNVLLLRSNVWRFNDTGSDLTLAPWKAVDSIESAWGLGRGPLGYGDAVTTTNSYGPDAANRYPTYYYRAKFNIDVPSTWLRLRLRCDDGAVVYHNGIEIFRTNLNEGPVTYQTYANAAVDGAAETTYYENLLAATNSVVGTNVIAVEVHQVSASNNDMSFDVELHGINPVTPRTHEVAALEVQPLADALVGDLMKVVVTATNRGNASETFTLYLRDTNANRIVASTVISNLAVGASSSVLFDWKTAGATSGAHTLQAFTVRAGVTNLAGVASAPAVLSGTGFGLNPAGASGSLGGRCSAITASGALLLVGAGATLEVWDSTNLFKLGQVRLPGLIQGIAAGSSYAYVACGSVGVQFVDLSVPSVPIHRNTFNSSGHAYGVALTGSSLCVADGVSGLRILNVANPAAPTLVGAYHTEGPARAVAAGGSRVYVLDGHRGLIILNIANPAAPTVLGSYTALDAGTALAVISPFVYVVDANNHLFVVNVVNPASPVLASSLVLTNLVAQGVAVSGTMVYVAAGASGLAMVNIAAAGGPALISVLPTVGELTSVTVSGTNLYTAQGFGGFTRYSLATPTAPVLLGDYPTAIRASDVVVNNGLAYVAAGEAGLRIYGVTNPVAPVWLGAFTGAGNARAVALSGTRAYVGDGQSGLKIVDVSNPVAPALLGSYSSADLGFIRNVGASGSLVLLNDGRKVELVDATTPSAPVLRATYSTPSYAHALAIGGSRAYLACGNFGLIILDITPTALTLAGSYDTPGFATGVAISGTTAHVADGANGWLMLNVSNPAAPVPLGPPAVVGPVADVAVSGILATLGSGANSAITFDVAAPLTPVTKRSFAGLVRALRLAAIGEQVFVAEDEAGLAILDSSADSDHDGMADAWEQPIIDSDPNDTLQTLWDIRPDDDLDGDGMTNLSEFLAGTSPTDAGSRFVVAVPANNGGPMTITWTTVPGKTYTVHRSTSPAEGFTVLADNLPATQTSFTDPTPPNPAFYIISTP